MNTESTNTSTGSAVGSSGSAVGFTGSAVGTDTVQASAADLRLAKAKILFALTVFATVGLVRKAIPMDSLLLSCFRAGLGAIALYGVIRFSGRSLNFAAIRKHLFKVAIVGVVMGFNWVFMFEAMQHTTVAITTICYYMEPVFLILASPIVFHEKITVPKMLCVAASFIGIIFVSGLLSGGGIAALDRENLLGILYALIAAVLYATCVGWNKTITDVPVFDRTLVELAAAAIVMLPLALLRGAQATIPDMTGYAWFMLLLLALFHTGFTYGMYYDAVHVLPAQTTALYSYIDPVLAVILSSLLLHEPMDIFIITGAVLIIGSALVSDMVDRRS